MWGANAEERTRLREVEGCKASKGDPLGGQWLRIHLATQGMSVRSLIRELRSPMPGSN